MSILTIRPTSDVSSNVWYDKDGGTSNLYANVDESSKNESDYNYAVTTYPYSANLSVKIGSTIYRSSSFTLQENVFTLSQWAMTIRPSDSNAWTWDDVDAFIGGCRENAFRNNEILYGFQNHTTESGTINKITLNSYLRWYSTGELIHIQDCMTWAEVDYTESAGLAIKQHYYQKMMR